MPITITIPASGEPFGPGYELLAVSDFIGPIEAGSFMHAEIQEATSETIVQVSNWTVSTPAGNWTFGLGNRPGEQLLAVVSQMAVGGDALISVTLRSPTGAALDTGTSAVKYSERGIPVVLDGRIRGLAVGQGAAAADLEIVKQSVQFTWPGSGVTSVVADLLTHPARGLLGREVISPDRTACGSLTRPGVGLQVNAFGLAWDVISFPSGAGSDIGAPNTFEHPFLDLALIHTDKTGDLYVSNYATFEASDMWWLFDPALPTRVDYCVAPGFSVRFYWLVF